MRTRLALLLATCALAHSLFGASVTVHVSRGGFDGPIVLQLSQHTTDVQPQWIAEKTLPDKVSTARFDDVAGGSYIVLASGPSPLQRATLRVVVASDDQRDVTLAIKQRTAHGVVLFGDRPLANADVRLRHSQWEWSTETKTDANGVIGGPIWEGGPFEVAMRGGSLESLVRWRVAIDEKSDTAAFQIKLPGNGIDGRLVDAAGKPVANALVVLAATHVDQPTTIRAFTGDDGTFAYSAVDPGPHTLDIVSNRHLIPDKVTVDVPANGMTHVPAVTLHAGRMRHVHVVDASGAKTVGAATVAVTIGNRLCALTRFNDVANIEVPTPQDAASVVWVVPASGSFAGALATGAPTDDIVIRIAPAAASLKVRTLTTAGKNLPNVSLLMAVNGLVIPPIVTTFLARQRLEFATNDDGVATLRQIPLGTYEIWPYSTEAEAEAWIAAMPMSAPVSLNVITGENQVAIKFASHETR